MGPKLSDIVTHTIARRVMGWWEPVYAPEQDPPKGSWTVNAGHGDYRIITPGGKEWQRGRPKIVDYVWRPPVSKVDGIEYPVPPKPAVPE